MPFCAFEFATPAAGANQSVPEKHGSPEQRDRHEDPEHVCSEQEGGCPTFAREHIDEQDAPELESDKYPGEGQGCGSVGHDAESRSVTHKIEPPAASIQALQHLVHTPLGFSLLDSLVRTLYTGAKSSRTTLGDRMQRNDCHDRNRST